MVQNSGVLFKKVTAFGIKCLLIEVSLHMYYVCLCI